MANDKNFKVKNGLDVGGIVSATGGNSTNWNTAFGWGNHATPGYLLSSTAASTYLPFTGGNLTGNLNFNNTSRATFGTNSALQIYSDATNSFIEESGAGALFIKGANLYFRNPSNESCIDVVSNGAVNLYYDNAARLATTVAGISVTGTITATGYNDANWNTAFGWGNHAAAGYLLSSTAASTYLPLAGGTLTGTLNGTAADFSGNVDANQFRINGTTVIDSSGNLTNIGTISSGAITTSSYMDFQTGGVTKGNIYTDASTMIINTQGTNTTLNTNGGNVGIGDTSPNVKLDVYQSTAGIGAVDFRHVNGNRILINPSYNYHDAYNHIFRGLNGTSTHMTIDVGGNVGIGTSSPSGALHVSRSGLEAGITLERTTSATAKFTMAANDGNLVFTDQNQSAERMRISSAGHTTFGTTNLTPADNAINGTSILSDGRINHNAQSQPAAVIGRTGTDGTIIDLRKNGSTVGTIGSASGAYLHIGSGDVGLRFDGPNDRVIPVGSASNLQAVRDAAVDLGAVSARFKDLYLSGSVVAGTGATNAATLNAYSKTVSTNLPSALRVIENITASSYWDIASTGGASNNLTFYANANTTPKMTLTGAGNLGIGVTPSELLHIESATTSPAILVKAAGQGGSTTPAAELILSSGSLSSNDSACKVISYRIGDYSTAAVRTSGLKFQTTNANAPVLGMTLDNTGKLLVEGDIQNASGSIYSFGNLVAGLGHVKANTEYLMGSTSVMDSNRNLTNIGKISSTVNGNDSTGGNILLGRGDASTNKESSVVSRQYSSQTETEGFTIVGSYADLSTQTVFVGGGLSGQNSASTVSLYTSVSGTAERTGTERVRVNVAGLDVRSGDLKMNGTSAIDPSRNINGARVNATSIGLNKASPDYAFDGGFANQTWGWYLNSTYNAGLSYDTASRSVTIHTKSAENTDHIKFLTGTTQGERFRVANSGVLVSGITTTSTASAGILSTGSVTTTTGYQPQNYHITFKDGSGDVRGSISTSHHATIYSTSSDYRLKQDVQSMSNATERLLSLNAVNFKWRNGEERSDGFLAHELAECLPEAVTGTKDGVDSDGNPEYQGIDQSKLVPLLVKTIQELEARIAALENA